MVSGGDKAVIKEMSFQRPKNTLQDVLLVISKVEHHIWKLMVNLDFSKSPSYSQHVNE